MKTSATQPSQHGFTVIELLIATTVFSVVLLLCSTAVIQIGRLYSKGIILNRTQETTRLIVDDITKAIQFSGDDVVVAAPNAGYGGYCLGSRLITFKTNQQVKESPPVHALMINTPTGACTTAQNLASPSTDSQEKLGVNMRLSKFSIAPLPGNPTLFKVSVRVVYGDDDLLCSPSAGDCALTTVSTHLSNTDLSCKDIRAGSQFCAASEFNSIVEKRVK